MDISKFCNLISFGKVLHKISITFYREDIHTEKYNSQLVNTPKNRKIENTEKWLSQKYKKCPSHSHNIPGKIKLS